MVCESTHFASHAGLTLCFLSSVVFALRLEFKGAWRATAFPVAVMAMAVGGGGACWPRSTCKALNP